jgi:hypothetical protein
MQRRRQVEPQRPEARIIAQIIIFQVLADWNTVAKIAELFLKQADW